MSAAGVGQASPAVQRGRVATIGPRGMIPNPGAYSDESNCVHEATIACFATSGSSARATTMPACMIAPTSRCESGSTAASSRRPDYAAMPSTNLTVPKA